TTSATSSRRSRSTSGRAIRPGRGASTVERPHAFTLVSLIILPVSPAPPRPRTCSDRGMGHAFFRLERLGGGLVEADIFREHDRRRAHGVGGGIDAIRLLALRRGQRRLAQAN